MKTFLFSVTAISLTGAALANGNEWSALDREVETLASSLVDDHGGITVGGYVDIWYATGEYSTSVPGFADYEIEEFSVNNARITLEGGSDGWGAFAQYALHGTSDPNANADGTWSDYAGLGAAAHQVPEALLDAYVTRELGDWMLQVGRFRNNMGASATVNERDMFFMNRSWIGNTYVGREEGIQVSGSPMEGINVSIGMSNGTDEPNAQNETDDTRLTIHADYTMDAITAGISFTDDGDSGGSGVVVDLGYTMNDITLAIELAEFDDFDNNGEGGSGATADTTDGSANTFNDSIGALGDQLDSKGRAPMAVSVVWPLNEDMTIGVRHQIADDEDGGPGAIDAESTDVAFTYEGYTFQYSTAEVGAADRDLFLVGFQVGF